VTRRPRLGAALLLAAAAPLVAASCALPGFEKVPGTGGKGGSGGAGGSCDHATVPARPTKADAGGTLDLVFAIHTIDFGEDLPLADRPGLDLDDACTCEDPAAKQCAMPPFAASQSPPCDSAQGIDNAAADLILFMKTNVGAGTPQINAGIAAGTWTILVRVFDYDGTPDDAKVSVGLYMSPGLGAAPKWDGTDAWPVRPESLQGTEPILLDKNAYVTGGSVVSVVSGEIELQGLKVKIGSGYAIASIAKTGAGWQLQNGLIAGSWNTRDALAGVGNLVFGGGQVCTLPFYAGAHTAICSRVDIASAAALPCDSLSFGMKFTADAAQLGKVAPPETILPPCKADQC
jgi:hypothetical protein